MKAGEEVVVKLKADEDVVFMSEIQGIKRRTFEQVNLSYPTYLTYLQ